MAQPQLVMHPASVAAQPHRRQITPRPTTEEHFFAQERRKTWASAIRATLVRPLMGTPARTTAGTRRPTCTNAAAGHLTNVGGCMASAQRVS